MQPFGRERDRLAPAVAGVALRADQAARAEPSDDLGHRRAIQRDAQAEGALVEVRLAVQRVEGRELRGGDGVRDLFVPQEIHRLPGAALDATGMGHQVSGLLTVWRLSLY